MIRVLILLLLCVPAVAGADARRDPTRPPQPAAARGAAPVEVLPTVTAVFARGDRRTAIFNGRLVRAGDSVGAYAIETVLPDGVRYRRAGAVREAHLPHVPDTVKKPTAIAARAASGVE